MPNDDRGAFGRLERKMRQIDEMEKVMSEMAQYILDGCGEDCYGDSSVGIGQCEWWRCTANEGCYLKHMLIKD